MKLCPNTNKPDQDIVMTPEYLAKDIYNYFKPTGKLLEPCKGTGAFYNLMPTNSDWCELSEGKDFMSYNGNPNWIITNPPWSKIRQFLEKSIELDTNNIVFLCNFNAFVTKARLRAIYNNGYGIKEVYCVKTPKENWPQTGFQLAATHIQKDYTGSVSMTGNIG